MTEIISTQICVLQFPSFIKIIPSTNFVCSRRLFFVERFFFLSLRMSDNNTETEDIIKPDLEIVGLSSSDNDRSCCQHKCCGTRVRRNDVLRLVKCVVTVNNITEEAIKLCLIQEGSMTCTVAFVPRIYLKLPKVQQQINRYCQVVELYDQSMNTYKRKLSSRNCGMASVAFLDDIPVNE